MVPALVHLHTVSLCAHANTEIKVKFMMKASFKCFYCSPTSSVLLLFVWDMNNPGMSTSGLEVE